MTTLGPYEILGELGRGGMGTVFRARHMPTGAIRAVKVLNGVPDLESLERFRREALALARLEGHGVVTVHETGVEARRAYFAMDLMPGGSLRARLRTEGRLEWHAAARLVAKLARTLGRSHELGLVHRDVKPDNVLFDEEGEPRLADWGCVRDLGASALTASGSTVGTTAYMAPEQHRGERVGPPADVFALGVLLHELVTGKQPYSGSPVKTFQAAIASDRVSASRVAGSPRELDAAIESALAPDPARRASASALAAALEAVASGKQRRPRLAPIVVLAVAALAVSVSTLAVPARRPAPPAPTPVTPPPVAPRETKPADEVALLERDAVAAVRSLAAECTAEKRPGLERFAGEANRRLAALLKKSESRCRTACLPLAAATWPLARDRRFEIDPTREEKRVETAIRDAIRRLGDTAMCVQGMLELLAPYDMDRRDPAIATRYGAELEAVAPVQSIAAAELEERWIFARAALQLDASSADGVKELASLRNALDGVRGKLALARVSAEGNDANYIDATLEKALRSVATFDERLAETGGQETIALLGHAIACLGSGLALAPMVGPAECHGLAVLRFKRIYACKAHDPPLDTDIDEAALKTMVHSHRFGVLDDVVAAGLLRLGSNDDRARARALAERACHIDPLDDKRLEAVALRALLLVEDGKAESAREALHELDGLRQANAAVGTIFVFGLTLEAIDALARAKLPGGR